MVPAHLSRYPTRPAIDALALRFRFPNTPNMQDWEWEVADSNRIDEFLAAYQSGELDDDERFTLMETIIASFEDIDADLTQDARWQRVLGLLDANITLHAHTLWYWGDPDDADPADRWSVTPFLLPLLEQHRAALLAG